LIFIIEKLRQNNFFTKYINIIINLSAIRISKMTNSFQLLFGCLFFVISLIKCEQQQSANDLNTRTPEINLLKQRIDELSSNTSFFYNYSVLCGGLEYDSRVIREKAFLDKSIPNKYREFISKTYQAPNERQNKCPIWMNNIDTVTGSKSGGMEYLSLPESKLPGEKIYILSANDPESRPLFYFMRKSEVEQENFPDDEIIFNVSTIKVGNSWVGEVILNRKVDYEKKNTYEYLTYAFDGQNLIEKYNIIQVTDVDDEKPQINTTHSAYSTENKQFEFKVYENSSIGDIINPRNPIKFIDVDTSISQLKIELVFSDSGMADSPFSLNNDGELKLINNLDYETQREYFLKMIVTVSDFKIATQHL
jgi:hypothetical protein